MTTSYQDRELQRERCDKSRFVESSQVFRSATKGIGLALTLDLDRVSPTASIQTYSTIILPFWSSFRYLLSCSNHLVSNWFYPVKVIGSKKLTFSVLDVKASRLAYESCAG